MMLYAQDAMETDKPWERWQIKMKGDDAQWENIQQCPLWSECFEYRQKPRTIDINGYEFPEPVRSPLEKGTIYYIPYINITEEDVMPIYKFEWCGDKYDFNYLKKGFVHLTEAAGVQHAKALLSFTCKDY